MKKLLALVVVLGLASFANAAVTLTLDGGTVVDGAKFTGDPVSGLALSAVLATPSTDYTVIIETAGDVTIDGEAVAWGAGWMFGNGYTGGAYTSTKAILSAGDFNPKGAGQPCFSGLILDGVDGTVTITEQGGGLAQDTMTTIEIVPEPMTMSLLGLGGLGLLRRRRA